MLSAPSLISADSELLCTAECWQQQNHPIRWQLCALPSVQDDEAFEWKNKTRQHFQGVTTTVMAQQLSWSFNWNLIRPTKAGGQRTTTTEIFTRYEIERGNERRRRRKKKPLIFIYFLLQFHPSTAHLNMPSLGGRGERFYIFPSFSSFSSSSFYIWLVVFSFSRSLHAPKMTAAVDGCGEICANLHTRWRPGEISLEKND